MFLISYPTLSKGKEIQLYCQCAVQYMAAFFHQGEAKGGEKNEMKGKCRNGETWHRGQMAQMTDT